jgi:hypothetical protein
MSVFGNMGESSINRPPNPHPISANSTLGVGEGKVTVDVAEEEGSEEDEEGTKVG